MRSKTPGSWVGRGENEIVVVLRTVLILGWFAPARPGRPASVAVQHCIVRLYHAKEKDCVDIMQALRHC